jgi:cytochrome c556
MRRFGFVFGLFLVLISGIALANIDFSDFDDDLMRSMDNAIKDLEPVLGAGNFEAAQQDLDVLNDGFKQTEDYFARKGGADDGIRYSRESVVIGEAIGKAIAAHDAEAAMKSARELATACKTCHDAYKPRK